LNCKCCSMGFWNGNLRYFICVKVFLECDWRLVWPASMALRQTIFLFTRTGSRSSIELRRHWLMNSKITSRKISNIILFIRRRIIFLLPARIGVCIYGVRFYFALSFFYDVPASMQSGFAPRTRGSPAIVAGLI
jgi:hypothetical protein